MHPNSTITALDSEFSLSIREERNWRWETAPVNKEWWLLQNGTVVAYLKTMTYSNDANGECRFVLCDIEVREGHRGQGLTR